MSKLKLPAEGKCRCGEVRITITTSPLIAMACHCIGCQRMSASAFSLSAAIPADGFTVSAGDTVIGGLREPSAGHHFCPSCMTWMFTRPVGMDWFVNLRPTMLDEPRWFRPFVETYTSTKLPFAETGAVHGYETFPPMEAYAELVKEYQVWAAG